jgi:hypothetical protein
MCETCVVTHPLVFLNIGCVGGCCGGCGGGWGGWGGGGWGW